MSCLSCTETFDLIVRVPMSGACGHILCVECLKERPGGDCSVCNSQFAFNSPVRNYQIIDMIKALENSEKERKEAQKKVAEMQKLIEQREFEEKSELVCHTCNNGIREKRGEKARVCKTCCVSKGWTEVTDGAFLPMVKVKASVICSSCFLEHHKSHKSLVLVPPEPKWTVNEKNAELQDKMGFLTNLVESKSQSLREKIDLPMFKLASLWSQATGTDLEVAKRGPQLKPDVEGLATRFLEHQHEWLESDFYPWLRDQGQGFFQLSVKKEHHYYLELLTVHPTYIISDIKKLLGAGDGVEANEIIIMCNGWTICYTAMPEYVGEAVPEPSSHPMDLALRTHMTLYRGGSELEDSATLSYYGIDKKSSLRLTTRSTTA